MRTLQKAEESEEESLLECPEWGVVLALAFAQLLGVLLAAYAYEALFPVAIHVPGLACFTVLFVLIPAYVKHEFCIDTARRRCTHLAILAILVLDVSTFARAYEGSSTGNGIGIWHTLPLALSALALMCYASLLFSWSAHASSSAILRFAERQIVPVAVWSIVLAFTEFWPDGKDSVRAYLLFLDAFVGLFLFAFVLFVDLHFLRMRVVNQMLYSRETRSMRVLFTMLQCLVRLMAIIHYVRAKRIA